LNTRKIEHAVVRYRMFLDYIRHRMFLKHPMSFLSGNKAFLSPLSGMGLISLFGLPFSIEKSKLFSIEVIIYVVGFGLDKFHFDLVCFVGNFKEFEVVVVVFDAC